MHFLVAEVHPFVDGNGRIARVMMNAELVAAGQHPIVIPTAYRENYLAAQRSPSAGNSPDPLPQALHLAQRWTAGVPWGGLAGTTEALARCNAFATEAELDDLGLRLLDGPVTMGMAWRDLSPTWGDAVFGQEFLSPFRNLVFLECVECMHGLVVIDISLPSANRTRVRLFGALPQRFVPRPFRP